VPAPAERVTILNDGDMVTVGDIEITAWDTPGHARHHLTYIVGDLCFTGDVAGVRLQGCDYLSVAAAPPQFEPGPYVDSVNRLLEAGFSKLYLAHFGEISDPKSHLERYRQRIVEVHDQISQWMAAGASGSDLADLYTAHEQAIASLPESDWMLYEFSNGTPMCAAGIELCVNKAKSKAQ